MPPKNKCFREVYQQKNYRIFLEEKVFERERESCAKGKNFHDRKRMWRKNADVESIRDDTRMIQLRNFENEQVMKMGTSTCGLKKNNVIVRIISK